MTKAAAKPKTTTSAESGLEQLIDESASQMAKSRILGSLMSMSWRLAAAILVPIVVGINLDNRFDTKPSYALAGFMFAIALASYMIYVEYQEIQADQKAQDMRRTKRSSTSSKKKGTA